MPARMVPFKICSLTSLPSSWVLIIIPMLNDGHLQCLVLLQGRPGVHQNVLVPGPARVRTASVFDIEICRIYLLNYEPTAYSVRPKCLLVFAFWSTIYKTIRLWIFILFKRPTAGANKLETYTVRPEMKYAARNAGRVMHFVAYAVRCALIYVHCTPLALFGACLSVHCTLRICSRTLYIF